MTTIPPDDPSKNRFVVAHVTPLEQSDWLGKSGQCFRSFLHYFSERFLKQCQKRLDELPGLLMTITAGLPRWLNADIEQKYANAEKTHQEAAKLEREVKLADATLPKKIEQEHQLARKLTLENDALEQTLQNQHAKKRAERIAAQYAEFAAVMEKYNCALRSIRLRTVWTLLDF